jgi:hypothetical protein
LKQRPPDTHSVRTAFITVLYIYLCCTSCTDLPVVLRSTRNPHF